MLIQIAVNRATTRLQLHQLPVQQLPQPSNLILGYFVLVQPFSWHLLETTHKLGLRLQRQKPVRSTCHARFKAPFINSLPLYPESWSTSSQTCSSEKINFTKLFFLSCIAKISKNNMYLTNREIFAIFQLP